MTLLHGIEITAREIGRGRGCGEKCLRTLTSQSDGSIIFQTKMAAKVGQLRDVGIIQSLRRENI